MRAATHLVRALQTALRVRVDDLGVGSVEGPRAEWEDVDHGFVDVDLGYQSNSIEGRHKHVDIDFDLLWRLASLPPVS